MNHSIPSKLLFFTFFAVALALNACTPYPTHPTGSIPTPALPTPVQPSKNTYAEIDAIKTICVSITENGNEGSRAENMISESLTQAGKQVVSKNCDAHLNITLQTKGLGDNYLDEEAKNNFCYTGSEAHATFELVHEGKKLVGEKDISGYIPISQGAILSCTEDPKQADVSGSIQQVNEEIMVQIWGPSALTWPSHLDIAFLSVATRGPRKADAVPFLIAAAKREPTNQAIFDTLSEIRGDTSYAIPFLIAAAENEPSSQAIVAALDEFRAGDATAVVPVLTELARSKTSPSAKSAAEYLDSIYKNYTYSVPYQCDVMYKYPSILDLNLYASQLDPDQTFDPILRECSLVAIDRLGSAAESLLPQLIQGLEKYVQDPIEYQDEIMYVILILGGYGPKAVAAVPDILTYWRADSSCFFCQEPMEKITGQFLGEKPEPWIIWWNEYAKEVK